VHEVSSTVGKRRVEYDAERERETEMEMEMETG